MGKFLRKHIYGEGIMDSVKSFFGKKKVKFAPPPPKPKPDSGAAKNAGDEIVKLLSDENKTKPHPPRKKNTQQQINNNRVLQILSGSGGKKLYNY